MNTKTQNLYGNAAAALAIEAVIDSDIRSIVNVVLYNTVYEAADALVHSAVYLALYYDIRDLK